MAQAALQGQGCVLDAVRYAEASHPGAVLRGAYEAGHRADSGVGWLGRLGPFPPIPQQNGPFPVAGLCVAHHNQPGFSSYYIAEVHHNNFTRA